MYFKTTITDETVKVVQYDMSGNLIPLPLGFEAVIFVERNGVLVEILRTKEELTKLEVSVSPEDKVTVSYYLNDKLYKNNIAVPVNVTVSSKTYSISYTTTSPLSPTSNTFLRRAVNHMPAWSTAYKNDVSVYSKTIFPIFSLIDRLFYKTNNHVQNCLANKITSYSSYPSTYVLKDKEQDKVVPQSLCKYKEQINKVTLTPINKKRLKLFKIFETEEDILIEDNVFNNVMIGSNLKTSVSVEGIDIHGNPYFQTFNVSPTALVTNLDKLKKITRFFSLEGNCFITNYCSCTSNDCTVKNNDIPSGVPNRDKLLEVPNYRYDKESKCLECYHTRLNDLAIDVVDIYRIKELMTAKKYFITQEQDIIVLQEDGYLYTGLLRTNLETPMKLYSSNNNNTIVSLPVEDLEIENKIDFTICTKQLFEYYGNIETQIRYVTDKGVLYLDQHNSWSKDKVSKIINNINPIYLKLDIAPFKYISIEVEANGIVYQASVRRDDVPLVKTDIQLDDMYHNGDKLIGIKDGKYYIINCEKDYVEVEYLQTLSYTNIDTDKHDFISTARY